MLKDHNSVYPAKTAPAYFGQSTSQLVTIIGLAVILSFVGASMAQAGTGGTEFDAVNNRIVDMVEGGGGKLAAGLGLVAALATSVIRFNIWSVIGAFGVGAMAGYGIPIVTSSVSAII
jgi:conjugal transfer pilus assembly protein TraA